MGWQLSLSSSANGKSFRSMREPPANMKSYEGDYAAWVRQT
jgi:hypothetical protein